MPVIREEAASEQRKRSGRGLWLLLLPPLILLLVLGAVTVRPLELGPIVIVSEFVGGGRKGCSVAVDPFPDPVLGQIMFHDRLYRWRGNGVALVTDLHYGGHVLGWFWGQRVR